VLKEWQIRTAVLPYRFTIANLLRELRGVAVAYEDKVAVVSRGVRTMRILRDRHPKRQHRSELFFCSCWESAPIGKFGRVL